MDKNTNIEELKEQIKKFCEDRDWDQFHNPKELAIGIITEAGELLDKFRFKNEDEMKNILAKRKEEISDELADVAIFLLRFSQKHDIDLSEAIKIKLEKNEKKYPAREWKGSNKKYDE